MTFSQNYCLPGARHFHQRAVPRLFSFNNPFGACENCTGLGTFMKVDPERILPNRSLSIREGAIKASGWYYAEGSVSEMYYEAWAKSTALRWTRPSRDEHRGGERPALRHQRRKDRDAPREEFGSGHLTPLRASSRIWSAASARRTASG